MKKIIAYGLMILITAPVLNSCKKIEQEMEPAPASKNMETMKIAPDFNWQTTKTIDVRLTSPVSGVVMIKSVDGDYYFNKGFIQAGSPYQVKITIPSYVSEVKLDFKGSTSKVSLTGTVLEFSFK